MHWYKEGDLNTKFFHASAMTRKKVNKIVSLETDDGTRVTDEAGMAEVPKSYFQELFLPKDSVRAPVLEALRQVVTDEDNIQLQHLSKLRSLRKQCFQCNQISVQGRTVSIQASISISGKYAVLTSLKTVCLG